MIEIYVLNLKDKLHSPVHDYLHLFTPERQQKILSYKHLPDQNRTLWAELLARHVIVQKTNEPLESIHIMRDSNGKPYISEYNLKFSISHSGKYAVCSIGENANGIDIESLSRARREIANHFFTTEERTILSALNDDEFKRKFTCYWTLKESYSKCTGIDLMTVIRNVNLAIQFQVDNHFSVRNFFLNQYVIGVCCENDSISDSIHEIQFADNNDCRNS